MKERVDVEALAEATVWEGHGNACSSRRSLECDCGMPAARRRHCEVFVRHHARRGEEKP